MSKEKKTFELVYFQLTCHIADTHRTFAFKPLSPEETICSLSRVEQTCREAFLKSQSCSKDVQAFTIIA